MKYPNLDTMLRANNEAKSYFQSLPDYVREQISTRPSGVNSLESLKDYAENEVGLSPTGNTIFVGESKP